MPRRNCALQPNANQRLSARTCVIDRTCMPLQICCQRLPAKFTASNCLRLPPLPGKPGRNFYCKQLLATPTIAWEAWKKHAASYCQPKSLQATACDSHPCLGSLEESDILNNSERRTWAPTPTSTIEATRICAWHTMMLIDDLITNSFCFN